MKTTRITPPKQTGETHPWQIYSYSAQAVIATYKDRSQAYKALASFWQSGTQVKLIYSGKALSHDTGVSIKIT